MHDESAGPAKRLLVVSHPAAVEPNQEIYSELQAYGWETHIVIPGWWLDGFSGRRYETKLIPSLRSHGHRLPVLLPGRPQRHLYVARVGAIVRKIGPCAAFVEEEPLSVSAYQWGSALKRAGVPFGLQIAENLDGQLPLPATLLRRRTLPRASFVAARSPRAAQLAGGIPVAVVPHHPLGKWPTVPPRSTTSRFMIGYAGRLVESKGIRDLLAVADRLRDVNFLFVGDGPLRDEVIAAARRFENIELLTNLRHTMMREAYGRMDVLVLPSRTTSTWAEQFGRVLVEALSSGVPVIGSDSGEIPWVINSTEGGLIFPEGDVEALIRAITTLREDPALKRRLAVRGRDLVEEKFSLEAAARQLDGLLSQLLVRDSEPGHQH